MVESPAMLKNIRQLDYTIVLCDDLPRMKEFYRGLFDFRVATETPTVLAMEAGSVTLAIRQRTRNYDGRTAGPGSPGVQIAFRVPPGQVDAGHAELLRQGVKILDPPTNQPWGHRTMYFADPEGNILELYEEL
jgi:catechol 2,3-dioxygenase-like lactoylglutathione lyase family enzyme